MNSPSVDVFFSCSFAEEDNALNEYFYAICKALDIRLCNVSGAFILTPPDKAKQLISDSQALIAICARRTEMKSGDYMMSEAVNDELSFAVGKEIPVLMFVEEGVQFAGFKNNFGTHLRFDREKLFSSLFLEQVIKSIHELKLQVLSPSDLITGQDTSEFYVEYQRVLVEMKERENGYYWVYCNSRRLKFLKPYRRAFKTSAWASVSSSILENYEPISWEIKVESFSKEMDIKHIIEKQTQDCVEVFLKIEPSPSEGDFIEYSIVTSSPFFNPIWDEDVGDNAPLHLEAGDFKCYDGVIPIHRTKKLFYVFRFPRSYGLGKNEIQPFVASHSSNIDYEVDSEIMRSNIQVDSFAGNIEVKIDVDSPLLRHIYGIAWNPKKKIGAS